MSEAEERKALRLRDLRISRTCTWRLRHAGVFLALAISTLVACRSEPAAPRCNVVLVVVDTLRADHLSLYGYPRRTSPHLDELAGSAVVFDQAFSVISMTLPAHVSLMTGIHPIGHKVLDNGRPYRGPFPTLAERLKRAGYSTAGFVTGAPIGKWSGIGRGFDIYGDPRELRTHKLPGTLITREAKRWLESAAGEPFFLFVHYFDVHPPYARGEGAVFPFEEDEELEALMETRGVRDLEMEEISDGVVTFEGAPVTLAEAINAYDNEIHHVDQMIGELLATLAATGFLEDTLLIVTSDHGEGLGEHGYYQHGLYLYEEQTHIPLVVRNYCQPWPARRVSAPASLLDVAPTLVEFLGLPRDERLHGRSLLPLLRGEGSGEGETRWLLLRRRAFGPGYVQRQPRFASPELLLALRGSEPLKLLVSSPGKAELYDLDTDPHEARNRAAENDAQRRRLGAILHSLRQSYVTDAPEPTGPTDRETIEALEALGYLQ